MKWIVFGDLHINKPFPELQLNPYQSQFKSIEQAYAHSHILYVIEILQKYTDRFGHVVFVGDITHYNQDKFDFVLELFDAIHNVKPEWLIDIVIGNHDTSNSYNLKHAKINKFNGLFDRVIIHNEPELISTNNLNVLFLPFLKRELITPTVQQSVDLSKRTVILSHNNIYITDQFRQTPMIAFEQMKQSFPNIILINGHIHRWHNEPDYFQIGSAAPTSFKEYLNAVGCCVFDDIDQSFKLYKNTWMFMVSVSRPEYQKKFLAFLLQAQQHKSTCFISYPFPDLKAVLQRYSGTVIAYKTFNDVGI